MILTVLINGVSILGILYGLYLLGRVFVPKLAEKDNFVSSPKLGRGKAIKRSGRIVKFISNFAGKGKHVNQKTGKVEPGEEEPKGFWWKLFGVHFIGLNDVYKYNIATKATEVIVNEKGDTEIVYTMDVASSIYLEGAYTLTTLCLTKDGIRLRRVIELGLETTDLGKALSLPKSWTIPVFTTVLGADRDFVGARNASALIASQNEGTTTIDGTEIKNSGYVALVLSLNTDTNGNVPLSEICGQRIKWVNVTDMDFADPKAKEAYMAPFVANQEAQKVVAEANAYAAAKKVRTDADLAAAKNVAEAITLKGEAEAIVYELKHIALGSKPEATAEVLVAEQRGPMDKVTVWAPGSNPIIGSGGK
jgi:hypothetical protein